MTTGTKPTVKLIGRDGNAFAIIGACSAAARKAGWSKDRIDAMMSDMMAGDYNHLRCKQCGRLLVATRDLLRMACEHWMVCEGRQVPS